MILRLWQETRMPFLEVSWVVPSCMCITSSRKTQTGLACSFFSGSHSIRHQLDNHAIFFRSREISMLVKQTRHLCPCLRALKKKHKNTSFARQNPSNMDKFLWFLWFLEVNPPPDLQGPLSSRPRPLPVLLAEPPAPCWHAMEGEGNICVGKIGKTWFLPVSFQDVKCHFFLWKHSLPPAKSSNGPSRGPTLYTDCVAMLDVLVDDFLYQNLMKTWYISVSCPSVCQHGRRGPAQHWVLRALFSSSKCLDSSSSRLAGGNQVFGFHVKIAENDGCSLPENLYA